MSPDRPPHVVIVGGGFAGLTAAQALMRTHRSRPLRVTVVDRQNHHLFQPLLYQVAMAGLSPADIAIPIRSVLSQYERIRVLMAEAVDVDFEKRRLRLHDESAISYDYLVVAAGARTNFFGHERSWGEHALGMKSLEDALEMRRRVLLAFEAAEREPDEAARQRLLTFAVIGGGPTGVEVAGALSELGRFVLSDDFRTIDASETRVVLIEAQDRLLAGGFTEALQKSAQEQLGELGVEVRLETRVEDIDEHGVKFENSAGSGFLEAATVLWTAGVEARHLTAKLGVERDRMGRIVVAPDCSIPGHPEVFAIGDMACFVPEGSHEPLPGLAPVAMQQGRYVARAIRLRQQGLDAPPFEYLDKGIMATIGRSRAVAQSGRIVMSGFMAWVMWLVVHIIYLVSFKNRFMVLFGWFYNYVLYRRGARLITGEQSWKSLSELADEAAGREH